MKKESKKLMCLMLVVVMLIATVQTEANAATESSFGTNKGGDDKYSISYDDSKYKIYWSSRKKIVFNSQYGSTWLDLDKGDKLGTATIKAYYLEPLKSIGGEYYAMAGCQVSMDPVDLSDNVTGMSQLAEFKIGTRNPESRTCSPTVAILNAQLQKSKSSSGSFTAGTGLTFGSNTWKPTSDYKLGTSWGAVSTYTHNISNVTLIQKKDNNGAASWRYDYKSKDENLEWNAYLMSSSAVAGQVVYRLDKKPTKSNRMENIPVGIQYDIRFGAGDSITGDVANRLGPSTNRDMSIKSGPIIFTC